MKLSRPRSDKQGQHRLQETLGGRLGYHYTVVSHLSLAPELVRRPFRGAVIAPIGR